ncbi:MAG: TIGR03013 family PEP-CTERM/XrtA system glycosyltransferase [Azoarcus sp.]|jgi:sugar transferase (PEP-CTERM system associated)|nr:TIGR03013 family PEP-CTERM/XrtA system glycosyltransferase [Azoarcus sp.]
MLKTFSQYFSLHVLQRIGLDLLLLVVAVIASAVIWADNHGAELKGLLPSALGFAAVMIITNFAFGLYQPVDEDSPRAAFARFVLSALFCLPVAFGMMLLLPWQGFASLAMRLQVFVLVLVVLLVRMLINRSQASSLFAPRILIVGTGKEALEAERILLRPEQGKVGVQGFFPIGDDGEQIIEEQAVEAEKILSGSNLTDVVKRLNIDIIIVAIRELRGRALPLRDLLDCKLAGVRILDWPSFHERVRRQVRLDSLRASWLIFGEGFQQPLSRLFFKRVFDLVISFPLLVLASPVMILVAFMIVFEDHGPIFYRQERVGQGGQVFKIIRFRCMRVDDVGADAGRSGNTAAGETFSRIGQIIHGLRIDRLPQLFNVLKGDMSLVGPHPERPSFVDTLAREMPFYGVRHCVKPGMTGWARVQYRNDDDSVSGAIQKLQYELYYVKNHSLVLDMLVLLETVHVVLMGKRAR